MNTRLFLSAILKFALGVVLIGALLFLPAGTLHYPQGWLLMGMLPSRMISTKRPAVISSSSR